MQDLHKQTGNRYPYPNLKFLFSFRTKFRASVLHLWKKSFIFHFLQHGISNFSRWTTDRGYYESPIAARPSVNKKLYTELSPVQFE